MHSQINLQTDFLSGSDPVMTTISKVAELAGVSRTTVSHVLNHADRVSPHLRARVLAAVEELGYSPNPQAQSLRTGRTNIVALLIPDILNPFYTELVKTAQTDLEAIGLDTMIFNSDVPGGHPQEHNREYLRQIRNKRVDGLIVGNFALHRMHDVLLKLDMPTVFIGDLPNQAVDNVKADDFGGGAAMGRYLVGQGHSRIAHVTGPSYFSEAMARADGFEQGITEAGAVVDPGLRYEGTYLAPSGEAAVDWLVANHRDAMPTAIFFANYLMAIAGLARLYDHGLVVPKDIAVAVFGNQPEMRYARPTLTRVGVAPSALAHRASTMLIERLNGTYSGGPRSEVLQCELQQHDSA
ncbi:MAG: alanine racemase [Devosia sp.]|nr:alanine racemase [Devosia sp.]